MILCCKILANTYSGLLGLLETFKLQFHIWFSAWLCEFMQVHACSILAFFKSQILTHWSLLKLRLYFSVCWWCTIIMWANNIRQLRLNVAAISYSLWRAPESPATTFNGYSQKLCKHYDIVIMSLQWGEIYFLIRILTTLSYYIACMYYYDAAIILSVYLTTVTVS